MTGATFHECIDFALEKISMNDQGPYVLRYKTNTGAFWVTFHSFNDKDLAIKVCHSLLAMASVKHAQVVELGCIFTLHS
jgi:hypothetical protein